MKKIIYILCLFALSNCNLFKKNKSYAPPADVSTISDSSRILENEQVDKNNEPATYQPSREKFWDLIHTKLNLSFDYKHKEGIGNAILILRPWFYAQDSLVLGAKKMDIKSLTCINGKSIKQYKTDSTKIYIYFEKAVTDTVQIQISYIAKPYQQKSKGSLAITEDRGLYFINADSSEPEKPTQIWTQGETEAASCWFPTIDAPNEKMTQEINLTVDSALTTLSNGKLVKTIYHNNKTKTDTWLQLKPHAPYLAMAAIGPWQVYHDKWRDSIVVDYLMEKEYIKYAKLIFGKTPNMLEFFSKKLHVDYPWDKFSQVVARDYVSGAMENTSAVLHGEFLNHDSAQHLDNSYEDVVSHELFHHWFGDLVTCESWSNLPLNESFATYGEYMWREFEYGQDNAEAHRLGYMSRYFTEAENKKEPLIRYVYKDKEDMFDSHSYQKGGLVLYTLRKLVGEDAFYKSLELYLKKNSFKTAEIHDLRLAFEEVTGKDLNWFFNQFFLAAGHPEIYVDKVYDATNKKLVITLAQGEYQNYSFPIDIEVGLVGETKILKLHIKPDQEIYEFDMAQEPQYIIIDPGKNWLCQWKINNTPKQWQTQYEVSNKFMDQYEALEALKVYVNADAETRDMVYSLLTKSLHSNKEGIVEASLKIIDEIEEISLVKSNFEKELIMLYQTAKQSSIRNKSILIINKINDSTLKDIYIKAIKDPSYMVMSNALEGLLTYDTTAAVKMAEECLSTTNKNKQTIGLAIASRYGKSYYSESFARMLPLFSINTKIALITYMGNYLTRINDVEEAKSILKLFEKESTYNTTPWYYQYMIRGNLDAALEMQKSEAIKVEINKTLNLLPPGGSMKMEIK